MPRENNDETAPFGIRRVLAPTSVALMLPSVRPDAVSAINRLSQSRGPIRLPVFGAPSTLRFSTLDVPGDVALTLALSVGGDCARLGLSAAALARLLEGLGMDMAVLDERPAQRAILFEYALLALLVPIEQRLGQAIRVLSADTPGHETLPASLGIALAFDAGPSTLCRLDLPVSLAVRLAAELDRLAPAEPLDVSDVPVVVAVSAGVQTLDVAEIESLSVGDVVMLDAALAEALVGDRLSAPLEPFGAGFRLTAPLAPLLLQKDSSMPDNDEEGGISALPIRVVFEFGRAEMTVGDLKALAPGSMLPLSRPMDDAVDIVANGRRIGRGSLVTIGDGIGVRITRLVDDARPSADE